MSSARLMLLRAILAVPVLFAGASKAPAGEADRIEARIEIFGFAGVHVLTNRTTVEEAGDRYSIAMDLYTRGLARVFVDLTSHSEVHGRLAGDTALPMPTEPRCAATASIVLTASIIAATVR